MDINKLNEKIDITLKTIDVSSKKPAWVVGAILGAGLILCSCSSEKKKTTPEEEHYYKQQNKAQKNNNSQPSPQPSPQPNPPKQYEPQPKVPPARALYGVG